MHENCNFYVENGSIYNRANPNVMLDEDITIIVDIENGILHKVGHKDWVTDYFNEMCQKYIDAGIPEMAAELKLIVFNSEIVNPNEVSKEHDYYINAVCTIINWFSNAIGDKMKWFLELPVTEAKNQIKKLQEIGF
jgi:hypothetical protein